MHRKVKSPPLAARPTGRVPYGPPAMPAAACPPAPAYRGACPPAAACPPRGAPAAAPRHYYDEDAVCIYCGLDGAEFTKGEEVPLCPVYDADTRRSVFEEYWASTERNYRL